MAVEEPTPLDHHIASVLERIGEVARADQWKKATASNLTPLQARLMGFVADHASELCGVARLASELQVSRSTVSDRVRVLVERGLMKRVADRTDARSHSLCLTDQGRKAIGPVVSFTALDRSIAALKKGDKETLLLGLMNVLRLLFRDGSLEVQRMCWTCTHYRGDRRTTHRCALMDLVLKPKDLRTDCPEHVLAVA